MGDLKPCKRHEFQHVFPLSQALEPHKGKRGELKKDPCVRSFVRSFPELKKEPCVSSFVRSLRYLVGTARSARLQSARPTFILRRQTPFRHRRSRRSSCKNKTMANPSQEKITGLFTGRVKTRGSGRVGSPITRPDPTRDILKTS